MSLRLWGAMPGVAQRGVSKVYAAVYNRKWSKHIIKPYCKAHYSDPKYLDQFVPASGKANYESFQDFFTRTFKTPPVIKSGTAWSCEGLLCEYGKVSELPLVKVKGEKKGLRTIFGQGGVNIPDEYYFSNVFLHNNNYHRIHSPLNGTVKRVEHIAGELILLRPWAYPKSPSLPALRNERVNVDLEDKQGRIWFLSIVGGPGVGTIVMDKLTTLNNKVAVGQELATFLLGSTCCMAFPEPCLNATVGDQVFMGSEL